VRNTGAAYFRIIIGQGKQDQLLLTDILPQNKIKSMEFDNTQKKISQCKIELINVTKQVLDHKGLQEESYITAQIGLGGVWQKEFKLIFKEVEVTYGLSVKANITALDHRSRAAAQRSGHVYSNKTASQIATLIAHDLGWKTDKIEKTTRKYPSISVGHKSPTQILMDLAWQENFQFSVDDDYLIFEPAFDLSKSKYRTFTYFVGKSPSIQSFKVKTSSNAAADATKTSKTLDPKTGQPVKEDPAATPSTGHGNQVYSVVYKKGGGFTGQYVNKPSDNAGSGAVDAHPDANKNRATAAATTAKWKFASAELVLLNDPVENNMVVNIQGVALKHSGAYKVIDTKYTISNSFLKVTAKLSRDTSKTVPGAKEKKNYSR